jgi:DNA-binding MarR family transcriptional regulator
MNISSVAWLKNRRRSNNEVIRKPLYNFFIDGRRATIVGAFAAAAAAAASSSRGEFAGRRGVDLRWAVKLTASPPLGLLIAMARKLIHQVITIRLEPFALTAQQFWVMLLLLEDAVESVQDMGRKIGVDKPASSRLLKQLAARDWVRFAADASDRRRLKIELTAAGRRQARQFRGMAMQLSRDLERGLDEAQRELLAQAMRQVIANLSAAAERSR